MASLVRPWIYRYLDKDGHRVKKGTPGAKRVKERARKWYAQGVPGQPPKKRIPLASDKEAARQLLAKLVKRAERGEAGFEDSITDARRRSLSEHLADFEAALRAKPKTSEKQVRQVVSRVRRIIEDCGFTYPDDINADRVQQFLATLRNGSEPAPLHADKEWYTKAELADALGIRLHNITPLVRRHRLQAQGNGKKRRYPRVTAEALRDRLAQGISVQTSNFYLDAVDQFCRWMCKGGDKRRMVNNPLADAERGNVEVDRRHDRRDLQSEELASLLETTLASTKQYRGLKGRDRHFLYQTACGTGFRADELARLTPATFALDANPPTVTLGARFTKNKKTVVQPLPSGLAAALKEYLRKCDPKKPVWPGTWHERAAEILRADLEAAGIPYAVEGPDGSLFADFHALRHTYVTMMERCGITPKAAQELARHSDVRLTLDRYTHANLAALGEAVNRLALPGNNPAQPGPTTKELATALAVASGLVCFLLGLPLPDLLVAPRVAPTFDTAGDILGQDGTEKENSGPEQVAASA